MLRFDPCASSMMAALNAPSANSRSAKRVSNRTWPPRSMIWLRMLRTTPGRTSLPIWGFASIRISAGAPAS